MLVSGDAHHGWLNSRALAAFGLATREDVVPESEWYGAYRRIFEIAGDETSPEAYVRTLTDAAAKGVVGVVDLEYGEGLDAWPERLARGADVLRVRRGVYADALEHTIAAGLRTGDPLVDGPSTC